MTRARLVPFTTDLPWYIIWSSVIGRVVTLPAITLEAESPTSMQSIPASSRMRADVKSYAVSIDIFSPRCFISMSRRVVTLRVLSEVLVDMTEMVFQAAKLQKKCGSAAMGFRISSF